MRLPDTLAWSCGDDTTTTKMELHKLTDKNAVCNDGTQAAYYFSAGTDPSLWLIYLGGGDWCYDEDSCAARAMLPAVGNGGYNGTYHTSSKLFAETCFKTGIFSEDPSSALPTANKVFVPYCTSDAHMGNREASSDTNGWHFRGATVVKSVLKSVVNDQGLGKAPNTKLVFGGGSAGARGAMTHLDSVAAEMPSQVEVLGFLDSNMWLDVGSYNDSFIGFGSQSEAAYHYTDAASVVNENCAMMYRGVEWKCIFGQYRMPFLRSPFFMTASQYDSWQLRFDVCDDLLGCDIPNTPQSLPYVDEYGRLLQHYMKSILVGSNNRSAVYSQACYNHHMSESSLFNSTTTSGGVTESDALRQYVAAPHQASWVDECQGYNCGAGC